MCVPGAPPCAASACSVQPCCCCCVRTCGDVAIAKGVFVGGTRLGLTSRTPSSCRGGGLYSIVLCYLSMCTCQGLTQHKLLAAYYS